MVSRFFSSDPAVGGHAGVGNGSGNGLTSVLDSAETTTNLYHRRLHSGVGSGVAPGARAPPCWIVLESFHKAETCFAGRIFGAWSGRPSLAEPLRALERAWLRGTIVNTAKQLRSAHAPGVMLP